MGERATDGRAARRLAATLGPPAKPGVVCNEETDPSPGGGRSGLLETGTGGHFAYGRQAASAGPAVSGEMAEPRFRWRLGIRAAALVGVLSLIAGVFLWWQVAANGPVVLPLSSVTHDSAAKSAAGTEGHNSNDPNSNDPDGNDPDGSGPDDDGSGSTGPDSDRKAAGGKEGTGSAAGNVVVHVAGAVKKAGVVQLPRGSRVHEAIAAAGGASPEGDLDRLNLASPLEDGQKIYVPGRGEPASDGTSGAAPADKSGAAGAAGTSGADGAEAGGTGGPASDGAGGKINLNTATMEELGELPRVGPVLAQRIVDWRTQQGPFKSPEELDAVDGVGPKMLETLLPLVTV
ncbi:ComEA family DNA-binding protein [Arthrobacter sp. FW305-BF8]|uniref:ComEA family DNA-binding protein n=2 Tax=unclassified Arthrobacter TaxID=235627 RepID=UPI001F377E43|nr:ComEA family DNA-binding protein [Arthrobacter sp. FW305-BF8]UKA52538.1 ComEA family DNA-binding protein [Arthrobacter sp. FW305-BF8]